MSEKYSYCIKSSQSYLGKSTFNVRIGLLWTLSCIKFPNDFTIFELSCDCCDIVKILFDNGSDKLHNFLFLLRSYLIICFSFHSRLNHKIFRHWYINKFFNGNIFGTDNAIKLFQILLISWKIIDQKLSYSTWRNRFFH